MALCRALSRTGPAPFGDLQAAVEDDNQGHGVTAVARPPVRWWKMALGRLGTVYANVDVRRVELQQRPQ